jgi:lysophospholipase L1-like esterase
MTAILQSEGAPADRQLNVFSINTNPIRSLDVLRWACNFISHGWRLPCPVVRPAILLLTLWATCAIGLAEEGTWKTAYVKRGMVGMFNAKSAGGLEGTQRMRTPLQFDGTKVRVYVMGGHNEEVELLKMALVKGADDMGSITGPSFPILFGGVENLKLEKKSAKAMSDELAIPVTKGTWYIQDQYASEKFPYAYAVDRGTCEPGDVFAKETLGKPLTCRTGILTRVDVLTTDPRNSILCFGDSITAGFNSTPNADQNYPAILGKLLNRPVLNLGKNGDLVLFAKGMPGAVRDLCGVDTVILLMGINDIITGNKVDSAKAYGEIVQSIIVGCHNQNIKIYIGTIPPAGGYAKFDADPAKETLRKEINDWIRLGNGADGFIDFDAALADPADPAKIKDEYQSDFLHLNDLGYQRMAEAAAKTLGGK